MICSSSTISRPDRGEHRAKLLAAAFLATVVALPVAADSGAVDRAIGEARKALSKGDGVAAEARLREARQAGASEDTVRAVMGEAMLAQGELDRARRWLEVERFDPEMRGLGFRMLGRLNLRERRLREAGAAFDKALAVSPHDAQLWTDIARLRFTGGEQAQAIAAAQQSVELDPSNPEALWFRGLLFRQQIGFAAALPWLESAATKAPGNAAILSDNAATLAELGRYSAALEQVRSAHRVAPANPRLLYQQGLIAARAGNRPLARTIIQRSKDKLRDVPGAILLGAALELDAGNVNLAVELADRLLRYQPDNRHAQQLLARAIARTGDAETVTRRFSGLASAEGATPYIQTIVARAWEELGRRDLAVDLLRRVAAPRRPVMAALPAGSDLPILVARYPNAPNSAGAAVPFMRASVARGQLESATTAAERLFVASPGAPAAAEIAGDLATAGGRKDRALSAYQQAARIEFNESVMLRLEQALRASGRGRDADLLIVAFAAERPQSLVGARLLANLWARNGQWDSSARVLAWIDGRSGARDPGLLADWAYAELRKGDRDTARRLAVRAAALHPAHPNVREIVKLTR